MPCAPNESNENTDKYKDEMISVLDPKERSGGLSGGE
jgi:hypothetical protein